MQFYDLSNYQETNAVDAAKAAGCDGVILKVSEGTTYTDVTYPLKLARARQLGLRVGTYHFFHGQGAAEAAFFLSHIKGQVKPGDLVPALDAETPPLKQAECIAWLAAVDAATPGPPPMFYSYRSAITDARFTSAITKYPLWLATGGGIQPAEPPWKVAVLEQIFHSGKFDFDTGSDVSSILVPGGPAPTPAPKGSLVEWTRLDGTPGKQWTTHPLLWHAKNRRSVLRGTLTFGRYKR